ncbi:hypothetical protein [Arthrobacter sp. NPDC056493]|uniref:hypothetical protein n=1 Tax=Arthrobacter sp. NPDC056493 TaxID=3345839 RepID=UPI00366E1665
MEILNSNAWIAAVAAPWAMAPHPNFSQDLVTGPSLLALVAQFRLDDVERYEKVLSPQEPLWVLDLVHRAKDSLQYGTVETGAGGLWDISVKPDIPPAARVAAALFASVAEVEMDEVPAAIANLQSLRDELTTSNPRSTSSLALGLVNLQIASRQFELFEYNAAGQSLETVLNHVSQTEESEAFPVSLGIGWDSHTVLQDIREAISAHRLELAARMEGFQGTTWVDVVKSRAPWPDYRGRIPAANRDRRYVEHAFDEIVGANRRRRTIYHTDPMITPALESLLVAELTGNVNAFMRERAALAQVRLLQHHRAVDASNFWDVQESLRLLRRARDKDHLKNVLELIYLQGPDAALLGDANAILRRSSFPNDVTLADLTVVSFAAQFLDQEDLERGLEAALAFIQSPRSTQGSQVADERGAWSAIGKLLPDSGKDNQVAQASLGVVISGRLSLDLVEGELLRVLQNLNWKAVDPQTVDAWKVWGSKHASDRPSNELARLASNIQAPLDYAAILPKIPQSALAEYLVRNYEALKDVSEEVIESAEVDCISTLQGIREEAIRGVFTLKSVDPGEVSVIFAKLFRRARVWTAVAGLLTDKNVARELKERALQRIAEFGASVVPTDARGLLKNAWSGVIDSKRQDIFSDGDADRQFTEGYRVGAVLGIFSRDEIIAKGTEISCSSISEDREAACDLLTEAAAVVDEWEWCQLLLLQLAHDADARVRSRAARSLASVSTIKTGISALVERAVVEALESDGINIPLMALHGLQQITHKGDGLESDEIVAAVERLKNGHAARVIRKAADHALNPEHREIIEG